MIPAVTSKAMHMINKQKSKTTVVSLFSGCGGLDWGFSTHGFKTVWANEFEKDAAKSFHSLIGTRPVVDDINRLIKDVPKADIIIGGPPCQSFSLVGKRLEDDPRSKLVFSFFEIVKRNKSMCFVLENVPGMTASKIDGKRLTEHLAEMFSDIGYDTTIEKIVATDYMVPQKRVRVFLIGWRGRVGPWERPQQKTIAKLLNANGRMTVVTARQALGDLPNPDGRNGDGIVKYSSEPSNSFAEFVRRKTNGSVSLHQMPTMSGLDREFVKYIPPGGNYMDIPDRISTTRILKFKENGGRTTTYGRLHPDHPAYTINTYFNRPNVGTNYHYSQDRLITVREALRLQSFPDHFTPEYSNQRSLHMQVGNAVPPLLSYAIASSIKKMLGV